MGHGMRHRFLGMRDTDDRSRQLSGKSRDYPVRQGDVY